MLFASLWICLVGRSCVCVRVVCYVWFVVFACGWLFVCLLACLRGYVVGWLVVSWYRCVVVLLVGCFVVWVWCHVVSGLFDCLVA